MILVEMKICRSVEWSCEYRKKQSTCIQFINFFGQECQDFSVGKVISSTSYSGTTEDKHAE